VTSQELWNDVDSYINELVVRPGPSLEEAQAATAEAGLPPIAVSAPHGKLLHLVARLIGARRILEVGTLGGYSTIWMAKALPPDGRLVSLEIDERHASVARANLAAAGVDSVAEVRVGAALDTLPTLEKSGDGPFDLVFIDADKVNIPAYFEWAIRLGHPGTVIIVDNVVRNGAVLDGSGADDAVAGVRRLNDVLFASTDVDATTIQTVGSKGYDGFTLAVVNSG
jgi:predicted O-methyltransferase YrrM